MKTHEERLSNSSYPGRGIVIGMTPDGTHAVQIYWIMGRSENSRNRIFKYEGKTLRTRAFDESKLTDPSLVIYNAMKVFKNIHIVSNGDQTDTIYNFLEKGSTFNKALDTRKFEPDEPNFTPRISGIVDLAEMEYKLSVLKTLNNKGKTCMRSYFGYDAFTKGFGHCITTYIDDGNPLPSFEGEPYGVRIYGDIDENARVFWNLLDEDNRVSLAVKFIDIKTGVTDIRMVNRNEEA